MIIFQSSNILPHNIINRCAAFGSSISFKLVGVLLKLYFLAHISSSQQYLQQHSTLHFLNTVFSI